MKRKSKEERNGKENGKQMERNGKENAKKGKTNLIKRGKNGKKRNKIKGQKREEKESTKNNPYLKFGPPGPGLRLGWEGEVRGRGAPTPP